MSDQLTHFDAKGAAHMVDVSDKEVTDRMAVAKGAVIMTPQTLAMILEGRAKKGDVLAVARLAGIMGAKTRPSPGSRSRPASKPAGKPAWRWRP